MTPYLHFRGTCAEAFTFYEGIFGGKLVLMRFGDAPEPIPGSGPEDADRVLHGELRGDAWALMGSDFTSGIEGDPQKAVSVMRLADDVEAGRALYDALGKGGDPVMPFTETFFSPGFGMTRDRFGTHWMISVPR